jgi:hypothetical protein
LIRLPTSAEVRHYVFADDDGAIFVHSSQADAVCAQALEIERIEREQSHRIAEGTSLREQFDFTGYLRRRHDDPPSPRTWPPTARLWKTRDRPSRTRGLSILRLRLHGLGP